MSRKTHRSDNYGAAVAVLIMLAVWFANTRGVFRCADDIFADYIGSHTAATFDAENVLLVYADRSTLESSDDQLVRLVDRIKSFRPTNIGIAYPLSQQQCDRLADSAWTKNLFVGAHFHTLASESESERSQLSKLNGGFLDLCLRDQSIYRWHVAKRHAHDRIYHSLEARMAKATQGSRAVIPSAAFGIRYRGGASALPHLHQTAFSNGSIVPELVAGRTVLIGIQGDDHLGLATPTTYGSRRMSRLELHGNILMTILRQNSIFYATAYQSLLFLIVVATISCHLFRQIRSHWVLGVGLCCLVAIGLIAWVSTTMWSTQIPVTAMGLVCCLNLVCVLQTRFNTLTQFFTDWKLLRRVNLKLTRQQSYDEIWTSVAKSAAQIFHPERLALLEIETAATHLRLREVAGCEKSDILEKRRDVSRSPYRDVFEQRRPVDIEYRPFFCTDGENTVQFMVPLVYGPDPQGLLVLEFDLQTINDCPELDDRLWEFAEEMSAFLAGIRERELERLLAKSVFRRLRFLPERIDSRALYQDEVEHRDYEELLDKMIEGLPFPVAIYDVFGNLLKSNARMNVFLQEQDISVADTGCAEILSTLTGRNAENCRGMVRRCLIDERSEEIVLSPTNSGQAARMLYVSPLNSGDTTVGAGIEHRSISIQLVDSEIFQEINQWHRGFVESQTVALQSQVQRLQQLIDDRAIQGQSTEIDQYLDITGEIANALEQCQTALTSGVGEEPNDYFATELHPILNKAIEITHEESVARGVKIVDESHDPNMQAICNPALLRTVFVSILERLLRDATRNSVITINQSRDHNRVRYHFDILSLLQHAAGDEYSAAGPTEDAVIDSKAALMVMDPHTEWINKTSQWLEHWGAVLRIECGANYQLSVELDLVCESALKTLPVERSSQPTGEDRDG